MKAHIATDIFKQFFYYFCIYYIFCFIFLIVWILAFQCLINVEFVFFSEKIKFNQNFII